MDYFTTPYFLFFRDTLSSVLLLGLLFAICLMPSTVTICDLEWVVLLFILGRIVTEVGQVMVVVKAGRRAIRRRSRLLSRATYEESLYIKQNTDSSGQTVLLRKFANYFRYTVHLVKVNSEIYDRDWNCVIMKRGWNYLMMGTCL